MDYGSTSLKPTMAFVVVEVARVYGARYKQKDAQLYLQHNAVQTLDMRFVHPHRTMQRGTATNKAQLAGLIQ